MLNSVLRAVHLQKTTRNSAGLSINATSPKCYINVSNIYVQNMKVCNRVVWVTLADTPLLALKQISKKYSAILPVIYQK